jgi:anti-sigma-K factor RskA
MKTADDRSDDDGRVPLFGTWKAIYAAVAVSAVVVMVLVALFSRWPY